MRIHALTFAGMGPFADPQHIDFSAVSEAGMFLLEGPTGVGKSTIIDAIVFALYGSVASADGDPGRLVSHFRRPGDEPFVEMVFSTAQGTYRVRRSPAHLRPRSRGAGSLVEQKTTATLQRLTHPDDAGGEAIAARPQDVGAELYRAVGLNRDQFVSTIVLPQGEFATFLRAGSRDRLPILQKIFRTHLYQDLQERLKQAGKQARNLREQATSSVGAGLEQFRGAVGAEELADVDGESPTTELDAALSDRVAAIEQAARDAADAQALAADAAKVADAELAAVDHRIALRDELVRAMQRRDALTAEEPAIAAHRAALGADARAGRVADMLEHARRAGRALREAREALSAAVASAPDVLAAAGPAALEAALEGIRTDIGSLRPALDDEASLPERLAASAAARDALRAADDAYRALQQRMAAIPAEREDAERSLQQLQLAADALPQLKVARGAAEQRAEAAAQLPSALAAEDSLRGSVADLLHALSAAEAEVTRRTAIYRAGIAATLGMDLRPGEPCPACGSREHPEPAAPSADHVTAHEVDAASAQAAEVRTATEEAKSALQQQQWTVAELRSRADGLAPEAAAQAVADARAAVAEAESAQRQAHRTAQRIEALNAEARETATAAQSAFESRADLSARADSLAAEVAALQERVRSARDGFDSVAGRVEHLRQRATHCQTLITSHGRHTDAAAAVDTAERSLAVSLRREGFADAEQAESARMGDAEREAAQRKVADHDQEAIAVRTALQRPELQTVDPTADIDRGPAAAAKAAADSSLAAATKAATEAQLTARRAGQHEQAIRSAVQHRDAVVEQTETAILLARLAEGNNPLRIDLATFVLVHRFRTVIDAANIHLTRMSSGRLLLEAFEDAERRNERAGLGIRIRDLHTETVRGAKSLSGGETFYASLALALGLAEIVTAESGGVELDTLFVDEGFGSLDPDTLDSVMAVLDGLQRNGRVLGLVSHVSEMKERIAERIEVRRVPETGASTLRVVA